MDDPATTFRRQQRRRALIGWSTAAIVVGLIAVGAIFGGEEESSAPTHPAPFGYSMTAAQYASLEPGLEEAELVDRLEQTGLPESLTSPEYVALFPAHGEDVFCSFWEISDRFEQVARICFSDSDGRLVEKLERAAGEEPVGVSA